MIHRSLVEEAWLWTVLSTIIFNVSRLCRDLHHCVIHTWIHRPGCSGSTVETEYMFITIIAFTVPLLIIPPHYLQHLCYVCTIGAVPCFQFDTCIWGPAFMVSTLSCHPVHRQSQWVFEASVCMRMYGMNHCNFYQLTYKQDGVSNYGLQLAWFFLTCMVCNEEDPPTKSISPVGVHFSPLPPRGGWTCTKIGNITVKITVSNQDNMYKMLLDDAQSFLATTLDQQDHSLRSNTNPQAVVLEEPSLQCLWGHGVYKEVYCGIEYLVLAAMWCTSN